MLRHTVGYLCPPTAADNFYTEPHQSAHAGFYACVGAFCRSRHFFAVGCRSPPPFVLEGTSTRTERKERSMSREKNIFEKFPQKWPKGVFARRVGGERGNNDLPSGAKGGEKMDLDRHDEHKQHAFDSFCKKVIRCEAYNAYRAIGRRQDLEIPFSQLPEEAMETLATWDVYPWEYTSFPVGSDVILIKDDRLAAALTALPQRFRDILLMYWFLELADREIGERLSLSRRTVNNRRQQAYELLKRLMGGDANE